MALTIEIKSIKSHGLEVWNVIVNGTLLSTHMSEAMARTKLKACIKHWNTERKVA
jgi:hypothetical protein